MPLTQIWIKRSDLKQSVIHNLDLLINPITHNVQVWKKIESEMVSVLNSFFSVVQVFGVVNFLSVDLSQCIYKIFCL